MLVLVVPYLDLAAPRAAEERSEVADRGGDTELEYLPDGDPPCLGVGAQRVRRSLVV